MENRYEIIKRLKSEGLFTELVHSGIIGFNIVTRVTIYEEYLKQLDTNKKSIAIQRVATSMKVSESNLYLIIRYLEQ